MEIPPAGPYATRAAGWVWPLSPAGAAKALRLLLPALGIPVWPAIQGMRSLAAVASVETLPYFLELSLWIGKRYAGPI